MTFGYTIYFKQKNIQKSVDGLNLLMHELVHVDQVRRLGDSEELFACNYGTGYLVAGSNNRNNPMEIEAYDFVKANAITSLSISSGRSRDKIDPVGSGGPTGTRPK